jgi:hypothetical protein
MKYIRIPFNRSAFHEQNGITITLFIEMLKKLPDDSRIIGFTNDPSKLVDYIFVTSDQFKEIPCGHSPTDATVCFINNQDGTDHCDKVEYGFEKIQCLSEYVNKY